MRHYRIARSIASMRRVAVLLVAMVVSTVGCTALRDSGCDEILSIGSDGVEQSRSQHLKGVRLFDHGKFQAAAEAFERAISLENENGSAHNNLGLVYYKQRKLSDAAREFETAAQFLPDDATPWNNLGMTLEAAGRGLESVEYYQHAYELAPEKPLYLGNLVRTRIRLGENDESVIEQLKELLFIETRPDWVEWINDQLVLVMNPELDRGPAPPNLNSKLKSNVNSKRGTNSRERQNLQRPEDEIRMAPITSGIGKSILAAPSVQISDIESVNVLQHPRIPKK